MAYNYFIPVVHHGPAFSYTYHQELPLNDIKNLIIGKNAKFEITRRVFLNSKKIFDKKFILKLKDNQWINKSVAKFKWGPSKEKKQLCYIETHINLVAGNNLKSCSIPRFYVIYSSPSKKNYLGCLNEKYGNPRVIAQMKEFGMWIDGYPAVNINFKNNTTYSLIVVNPYDINIPLTIEINDLNIRKKIRIDPLSVKRIGFFEITNKKNWTGQFYIYGKRRALLYLVNHAFNNFNDISTIEHGDPFRAEYTYLPRLQFLRSQIHKQIKGFLRN